MTKTRITVNLNGGARFQQFRYPAGEWQVRFPDDKIGKADSVRVIARIGAPDDIIRLALLKNAIGNKPYCTLILPYLPYSRADRRFTPGDCCGLEVFGQMLAPMQFDSIVTLDAHNHDAAELYVAHLIDRKPDSLIHRAIADFAGIRNTNRVAVLFPDEGARVRYSIPERIACNTNHIDIEILHAAKKRNRVTGKFEGFDVPDMPDLPALIVDDICDGGGTFTGIAGILKNHPALALYVTHGIFSLGFGSLERCFNRIYTTNTIEQNLPKLVTVLDAMPVLLNGAE